MNKYTVMEIVSMGMMTAILFAAQVLMGFLPNIEIVSLLIVLYAIVYGKKVFFIYTCAKNNKDFSEDIQNIVTKRGCESVGSYGCKGFNTYGPLKIIGGMNKSNPTEEELQLSVQFFNDLEAKYGN